MRTLKAQWCAVRSAWQRPVSWGAVFLSYIGIIGAVAYGTTTLQIEQNHRQTQICQVLKSMHENAKDRERADGRRVAGIKAYLADPQVARDALYARVKETLPRAREDHEASRAAVLGSIVPSTCRG